MFYGLDVHKEFVQVCQISKDGKRRRDFRIGASAEAIEEFAARLGHNHAVALEATFHSWAIQRILQRYAGRVVVVNPLQVKAIAHAKIKTDKVDAHTLAQLLRADYLPAVVMPNEVTWGQRQLVSHRRLLVKQQTAIKNTIHGVFNRLLIRRPEGVAFTGKHRQWMRRQSLPQTERFLVDNALKLLEQIEARVKAVDAELLAIASVEEPVQLLMTIPGIDVTVAIGLLAAIGDVRRFPTPGKLAAYFGLVPKVSQSAGRTYHGRITKAGPSTARSLTIEAAQVLARSASPLAASYHRVRRKRSHNVAVTALARKLVVVIWHLLHHDEPYRYAPVPRTRQKLQRVRRAASEHGSTALRSAPRTLEMVYQEAGLPTLRESSPAERRAAASNRRTRTRLAHKE
jgi:transposase